METSKWGEVGGESPCKGCGQTIFWVKTKKGKNMPVDASDVCHWETCPARDGFRPQKMVGTVCRNKSGQGFLLAKMDDEKASIPEGTRIRITVEAPPRTPHEVQEPQPPTEDDIPF